MKMKMKKRILGVVMSFALIVATVINPMISYAEDDSAEMTIDKYRSEDGNHTAPVSDDGRVFAGWYTDDTYSTAISKDQLTGVAVPKWVDADVLGVKYQIPATATIHDGTTGLRLITSVDSTDYAAVGFVLNVNGQESAPAWSYTVYDSIKANVGGSVTTYYPKQVFDGTVSNYFVVYEITGVPNAVFNTDIKVIPQWKTLDGTVVRATEDITVSLYDSILAQFNRTTTGFSEAQNYIYIDVPVKAGQTFTYDLTLENIPTYMALWTAGIYSNNGTDASYNLHDAKVYSSSSYTDKTITVTGKALRDVNYVRLQLQDRKDYNNLNASWTCGAVTISNIRVQDEVSYSNLTKATNTITVYKGVKAGQSVSYDLTLENPGANTAVWTIGVKGDSSTEMTVGVYNFANKENKTITFTAKPDKDMDYFQIKIEQRDTYSAVSSAWTSGTVTISNICVKDEVSWSFTNSDNTFYWYRPVSAGQPITFDLSVESMESGYIVLQEVIGFDSNNTPYYFESGTAHGVTRWGKNNTIKFTCTPNVDIVKFRLRLIDWSAWGTVNSSWTRGEVKISNVVNKEIHELATAKGNADITWKKSIPANKTVTFDLSFENEVTEGYVVLMKLIGNPSATNPTWFKSSVVTSPSDYADDGVYTVSFNTADVDVTEFMLNLVDWSAWDTVNSSWTRGRIYISNITIE